MARQWSKMQKNMKRRTLFRKEWLYTYDIHTPLVVALHKRQRIHESKETSQHRENMRENINAISLCVRVMDMCACVKQRSSDVHLQLYNKRINAIRVDFFVFFFWGKTIYREMLFLWVVTRVRHFFLWVLVFVFSPSSSFDAFWLKKLCRVRIF